MVDFLCQITLLSKWEHSRVSILDIQSLISNIFLKHFTMQEGTIARLTDRGFGFISQKGEEKDLFFHSNELVGVDFNSLKEGDSVTFDVADSPKGPNAVKVSLAK